MAPDPAGRLRLVLRSIGDLFALFDHFSVHKLQRIAAGTTPLTIWQMFAPALTAGAKYRIIKRVPLPCLEATNPVRQAPAARIVRAAVRDSGCFHDGGSVSRPLRTRRCRTLPVVLFSPRGGGCAASVADCLCASTDRSCAGHRGFSRSQPCFRHGLHSAAAFFRLADPES